MKIVYIGTYPPRKCGIGTFTHNLLNAVSGSQPETERGNDSFVIAMNDFELEYDYPEEVKFTIRQEQQRDYLAAAEYINLSGADCCILEHEFGIFGGQNGVYILSLLHKIKIPLVVTLHTILKTPSYNQKEILQRICRMANRVVVMSKKAVSFLENIYDVPQEKIAYIEHGVPNFHFSQQEAKAEFKLQDNKVLLTFGFVSRNKGIETAIKAMPSVIKKHPEALYIILGKTHPHVLHYVGEEYRNYLLKLVRELQVEKNVVFVDKFVSEQDLFKYLYAADIYITPYLNEAQITSGTLSYAVGVGCPVVSTPYWHAAELLDDGKGVLFDFNQHEQLAEIVIDLLDHPDKRSEISKNAYRYGQTISWPKIGGKYNQLIREVIEEQVKTPRKESIPFDIKMLPPFSLAHVRRLTDDTGIIQHAKFGIPNLKEGYCLDDNARALMMALMAYKETKDKNALELSPIYLSYIQYMQNEDGTFRNFLSFDRRFLDEHGSEDAFGRAIWAMGYLLNNPPNDSYYQFGKLIFDKAVPTFGKLRSIRSIANVMIGISYYLKNNMWDDVMIERLRELTAVLADEYRKNSDQDWKWYERLLAYDNAILPLAMLHAAEILKEEETHRIAFESMQFLMDITLREGYLSIIGNEKWFHKEGELSKFAQQPVDAMCMVLMLHQAYKMTDHSEYLTKLFSCFMWFMGKNDLRINLYNYETGGCCDGIEKGGVSRNQGAESTLAYLISYLIVMKVHEEYYSKD
ncbi:MAG: glycosyltransferase family 4 protein [Proteiniphilum sp.]